MSNSVQTHMKSTLPSFSSKIVWYYSKK